MEELILRMTLDDLPLNCREIAEVVGIDDLIKICEAVGGGDIYIPRTDTILKPARDRLLKEEFNGFNHRELADRYNMTLNRVRQICGEGILQGQISIFEEVV